MFATKQKFKITGRVFLQMPIGTPSFPDTSGGTDVLAVIAARNRALEATGQSHQAFSLWADERRLR
jgi:hypothetical protein